MYAVNPWQDTSDTVHSADVLCCLSVVLSFMSCPASCSAVLVKVSACRVLSRVYLLIVEELHEVVEASSHGSAEAWPDPVDPVVSEEFGRGYSRTEASGRVE